jgi:hypothetical protein
MNNKELGCENAEWIHLALDTVQWQTLVNTVIKLRVAGKAGNLLTS